jgi:hypothetical protein
MTSSASSPPPSSSLRQPGSHALPPSYQAYDEVRIETLPRFKSSALSGSEWRIAARTRLLYKGTVEYETYHANVDEAARELVVTLCNAAVARMNVRAPQLHAATDSARDPYCDQEGCAERATTAFRVLSSRCTACGSNAGALHATGPYGCRYFCARHSTRGEGYLDDTAANYELVAGAPPAPPPTTDVAVTGPPIIVYADATVGDDDDDDDDDDDSD